jgi:prepilin signal peptidase PulO-like enzyme (type II secretory pathway)
MDYEGQKLAELLFYWIILSFGGVGWVIGYFQQDFFVVVQAWLVGVVISVIVSTVLNEQYSLEAVTCVVGRNML